MNHKQYSEIQHCLGVLEGVGYALEGQASLLFYETLEALNSIIDKLQPEIGNEEGCPGEECSPTEEEPDGLQLYTKYDFNTDQPVAYAYGEPWVERSLREGVMAYPTPEEAKAAWEKMKQRWDR